MKNNIIKETKIDVQQLAAYKYYSISRLESYRTCPQYYYNKYIAEIKIPSDSNSTITGSIIHGILENYYSEDNFVVDDNNNISIEKTMGEFKKEVLEQTLQDKNLLDKDNTYLMELLDNYITDYNSLAIKATKEYKGIDSIRNRDGSISKKPSATSAWKNAARKLNLDSRKATLDKIISSSTSLDISVPDICVEVDLILNRYKDTIESFIERGYRVKYIELPISKIQKREEENGEENFYLLNPVKLPKEYGGEEGIYLVAYIDIILEHPEENFLVVIDHKTNKATFNSEQIQYNSQILTYRWALSQITDQPIKEVGINNIRSSELNIYRIEDELEAKEIVDNTLMVHKLIETEIFPKFVPSSRYSKCLNMYNEPCPYLDICWNKNKFNKNGKTT